MLVVMGPISPIGPIETAGDLRYPTESGDKRKAVVKKNTGFAGQAVL